jgi:enoyl-CoA hydratase/carnithine racemase
MIVAVTPPPTTAKRVQADGAVGHLTLARPEKLNALNRATLEELAVAAAWFDEQPAVKVVVVDGDGRAFSAGFDLGDRSWQQLGPPERSTAVGRAMAEAIGGMQAITIASIRGHCIGGGVVLAAACDLRVASTTARFRIPEIDLGVPLFWTGVPRLARELGPALTKELVLTGRTFDAEEAKAMRFVNRVAADDALDAETSALATELASKPGLVLRTTKLQVEAAAPLTSDGDAGEDAARSVAALTDEECRAIAAAYVSEKGGYSSTSSRP